MDKDTDDFHLKPSDATDCSILESEEFLNVSGKTGHIVHICTIWLLCASFGSVAYRKYVKQLTKY